MISPHPAPRQTHTHFTRSILIYSTSSTGDEKPEQRVRPIYAHLAHPITTIPQAPTPALSSPPHSRNLSAYTQTPPRHSDPAVKLKKSHHTAGQQQHIHDTHAYSSQFRKPILPLKKKTPKIHNFTKYATYKTN